VETSYVWLRESLILDLHQRGLDRYGGTEGIRDRGLLQSALARPQHVAWYQPDETAYSIAATYCIAIVKNHPFIDGNKRTGALAVRAFLAMNGYAFRVPDGELHGVVAGVASSDVTRGELIAFIEDHTTKR
jgi:death on curing protein